MNSRRWPIPGSTSWIPTRPRSSARTSSPRGFTTPCREPTAPAFFSAADTDKDGSLTRAELKGTFAKWFGDWDSEKSGSLDENKLRDGLNAALPRPNFAGGGGGGGRGPGGPGGPEGGGGFGGRGGGGGGGG